MGKAKHSIEEEVMHQVADELNIPYHKVRDIIIGGQSKFTAHVMKSATFNGVRWPYLGSFVVKSRNVMIKRYKMGLQGMHKQLFERWAAIFIKNKNNEDSQTK